MLVLLCRASPHHLPVRARGNPRPPVVAIPVPRQVSADTPGAAVEKEKRKPIKLLDNGPSDLSGQPASFTHLPPEIRQRIYDLVLSDEQGYIIEPQAVGWAHWSRRPPEWEATGQYIRSDRDSTSKTNTLHTIMAVGGTELRRRRGQQAIFQEVPSHPSLWQRSRASSGGAPRYLDLMRTCRLVYGDVLDRLYSQNTISLFGNEMVGLFGRIAPEAGLARVRYVHVALIMAADNQRHPLSVEKAISTATETFPSMQQLDLEIALLSGQPANPVAFWAWLCGMLERHLTTTLLEEFVLKVPVYWAHDWWPVDKLCPAKLRAWEESDYLRLKTDVCNRDEPRSREAETVNTIG
ncbi:hypothetical protein PG984_011703 [Apiospora sp. TS-2023a]